jgi:hypothetical protein
VLGVCFGVRLYLGWRHSAWLDPAFHAPVSSAAAAQDGVAYEGATVLEPKIGEHHLLQRCRCVFGTCADTMWTRVRPFYESDNTKS